MSKVVLDTIASGYDLSKINTNFSRLATAIENTLSRDGTSPNLLAADIDMNDQRIYNLPDPIADGEPVTKAWIEAQPASTAADAASAAASAATAQAAAATIDGFEWTGAWTTATAYVVNNLAYDLGQTYVCIVAHTSTDVDISTDYGAGKWELFASKGAAGVGTGDMLAAKNLSDVASVSTARNNLLAVGTADIGVSVQAYDADTLKADTADVLTAGFGFEPYNAGTKSSGTFTLDAANGNSQYCVNGGAFTLAPPTQACSIVLEVLNNASAGIITTSGFTKVVGSFATTDGYKYACNIVKTKNYSLLQIQGLQ